MKTIQDIKVDFNKETKSLKKKRQSQTEIKLKTKNSGN